ncbi:hypothetical protein LOTGIDRAFT_162020 [Lottia gigantea]|uniref:Phospholipase A2-like domain-containing protein n=1 Tax=Lottia gigantea TaxID=225164 RepID=V4AHX3_LOTGI|nr:hypothetical protein LOTGIDRAFT_162020 [Lottia gigantea]ESO92996.1 hypothetical protein LOTGIDRAFT_162020 [Lottia gigantea]
MSLINVHPPKTYFGVGDIQNSLGSLPGFPWAKYPGEKHLPGHNYTGPGTRLDLRLDENDIPKPGEEPVNRVDAAALKHDILYRNKDVTFRHQADKQMIDELENIPNPTFKEKLQRALIIKLMKAKLKLDTLKQQLTALDTKITDELEKEVGVIKNFLQNKFRDDMKNYIKEQVNLLVSRIHDDFLTQEKKLSKLEAIVTDKSYYFNLPFESDTVFDRKDQIYKSNKYGFKAEIKVGTLVYGEPKNVFDIGEKQEFTFRGNCLIQIEFPMKVKVKKVVFKQGGRAVKHISLFNDGNLEENIRLIDIRNQEIETKNGSRK